MFSPLGEGERFQEFEDGGRSMTGRNDVASHSYAVLSQALLV